VELADHGQGVGGFVTVTGGTGKVAEVEDARAVKFESVFAVDGAVGMEELVGDVGQNGGATRGDAALGDLDEQTGEKLVDVHGGLEFREFGEEFGGEIVGVGLGLPVGDAHGGAGGEVVEAKTKLGIQAGQTTALAVGKMILTARWVVDGAGVTGFGVHGFLGEGVHPPWKWIVVKTKELREGHFANSWKEKGCLSGKERFGGGIRL
jgi:hypothetical protein